MTAREVSSMLLEMEASASISQVGMIERVVNGLRVGVLLTLTRNPVLAYFLNGRNLPFDDVFLALLESHDCGPLCPAHVDQRDTSMGVLP